LKRFSGSDHEHLIRLLVTFEHHDQFHLVFHWADGNLLEFWQEPRYWPENLDRGNPEVARWMAKQCLGLAKALQTIQTSVVKQQDGQSHHSEFNKVYGRHGNVKPENILWFSDDGLGARHGQFGVLKISDFGMADFRGSQSAQDAASHGTAMSRTYRAPEYDVNGVLSPRCDIWSFGCILLEFVVWYVRGGNGVTGFSDHRARDSTYSIREDNFYNHFLHEREVNRPGKWAKEKMSVSDVSSRICPGTFKLTMCSTGQLIVTFSPTGV